MFLLERLYNTKLTLLVLFIVCFLAYGLTLDMYFWKDDFALMIKAQHPEEPVGFFGPGLKGDGAYRYITLPFSLLYPTFHLNAWAYFFIGILLYFLASVGVYTLSLEFFRNRFKAFLSGLIFSSGFIGADSIFGLTNSYQTSWVIFFLCLSLVLFLKSFRIKDLSLYILSVFIFLISLETGYVRAHGYFLIVLATGILIFSKLSIRGLALFLIKLLPFFLIFKLYYLNSTPAQVGSSQLSKSFESGNFDYFLNPLITFINVVIPTPLIKYSNQVLNYFMGRSISPLTINLIWLGTFIAAMLIFLSLKFFDKKIYNKDNESLRSIQILFFALFSIFGSFAGVFFIGAASTYLESTHRYLSTALIGLSFFWVSLFGLIFQENSKKILISTLGVSILYLSLGNLYAIENINTRTKPQKEFFTQLKKELPEIKDKTFIYFDVSNKNNSQGKFGNIFGAGSVGGSPEITVHYEGVDRYDVLMSIGDFKDFVRKLNDNKGSIENSYAFYFEDNILSNKTTELREILKKGIITPLNFSKSISHEVRLINSNGVLGLDNTTLELVFPKKIFSLADGVLKFNLQIVPNYAEKMSEDSLSDDDKNYLKYLLSKANIINQSKPKVFNHFQNQVAENLFDAKIETTWMANRGPWHNMMSGVGSDIQFIEVYLSKPLYLGGLLFTNGHTLRTPTSYKILVRSDGGWEEIKKTDLQGPKVTNEIWFDKFDKSVFSDNVRIEILKSASGDAPQLAELELVEDSFSGLDFSKAQEIETDPSILLKKSAGSELIQEYFRKNGKIAFSYLTNKDNNYNVPSVKFNVKGLNQTYNYEIPIAGNGTTFTKGKFFNLNFPARYIFSDFTFINPSLDNK